jgi:hypothetical protein
MSFLEAGGFAWEPAVTRARRVRILGAVALLLSVWAAGFFAGRISAWLSPVSDAGTRIESLATYMKNVAERAQPRADPKMAEPSQQPPAATQQPAEAAPARVNEPNIVSAPLREKEEEKMPADVARPDIENDEGTVAHGNRHWRKARRSDDWPESMLPDRMADSSLAECERRYSSFRRSDGTYQPYGSRPREVCPLLR